MEPRYPNGGTRRFWPRFVWLALRNKVHNWRRYITGVGPRTASNFRRYVDREGKRLIADITPTGVNVDLPVGPSDTDGIAGFERIDAVATGGLLGWLHVDPVQLYWIIPWTVPRWMLRLPSWIMEPHPQRCISILIGWKIWNLDKTTPERAALVVFANPLFPFGYRNNQ